MIPGAVLAWVQEHLDQPVTDVGPVTGGRTGTIWAVRAGTGDPVIRVAGFLNSPGSSPWAAGVGRLRKGKRAGDKAVRSEYEGMVPSTAC